MEADQACLELQIPLNPHNSHDIRIRNRAGSKYVNYAISTGIVTASQSIIKFLAPKRKYSQQKRMYASVNSPSIGDK